MRKKEISFFTEDGKKEFTAILHRQSDIGGRKNNLLIGNQLIRTKTLGCGDDCYDFYIIGNKKV